ncbi:MAG: type II secretion system F family protein [Actinomycetia bacterium]|nr:type II secretion system F family protein [Actinomycetes bacterium]
MIAAVILGAVLMAGVVILLSQVRPAPPHLKSAMARLYPANVAPPSGSVDKTPELKDRLGSWLATRPIVTERIQVPSKELNLLGIAPARFLGEKALYAVIGLLFPIVLTSILGLIGVTLPLVIPAGAGIGLAVVLSMVPDAEVRAKAKAARAEFTRDIGAYLDLVALERKGGSGAAQALESAAAGGDNWVFRRLQEALAQARWSHTPAWEALSQLADDLNTPALSDVADIMRIGGEESAGVYTTLRARSQSLRNQILTDEQARANADNERMIIPVTSLAMVFIALLGIPAVMQIAAG